jgi:hypothetical protein
MAKEATGCMKNPHTSLTCPTFREYEKCSLTHIIEGAMLERKKPKNIMFSWQWHSDENNYR